MTLQVGKSLLDLIRCSILYHWLRIMRHSFIGFPMRIFQVYRMKTKCEIRAEFEMKLA